MMYQGQFHDGKPEGYGRFCVVTSSFQINCFLPSVSSISAFQTISYAISLPLIRLSFPHYVAANNL